MSAADMEAKTMKMNAMMYQLNITMERAMEELKIARVRAMEDRITALLKPFEFYVLLLHRILVWDVPYATAALYISVHILFWLSTFIRMYCLIAMTCAIVVALHMWIISANTNDERSGDDELDSWTVVNPGSYIVAELSHYLAEHLILAADLLNSVIALRDNDRPKFFVQSLFYLVAGAVAGSLVSGFWIVYAIVMLVMVTPCLKYHKVYERFKEMTAPYFTRVENKLKIRRTRRRTKTAKRSKRGKTTIDVNYDEDSDSDDVVIDEFVPQVNTAVESTLTSALSSDMIWDEEDDDLLTGDTPTDRLSPQLAHYQDNSDDDLLAEDMSLLAYGLGREMPSMNDVDGSILDRVGDASLDPDEALMDTTVNERTNETNDDEPELGNISRSVEHRDADKDSDSETEVDEFAAGLAFTDEITDSGGMAESPDILSDVADSAMPAVIGTLFSQGHSRLSTLSAALSTSSLTGILSSGLNSVREAVGLSRPSNRDDAATDSDILDAEFEFLDHEDLGDHDAI